MNEYAKNVLLYKQIRYEAKERDSMYKRKNMKKNEGIKRIIHLLYCIPAFMFFISCSRTNIPRTTIIHCSMPSDKLIAITSDSVMKYGFAPFKAAGRNKIEAVRRIDDGLSIRTVHLDIVADSAIQGLALTVKTITLFRQSVDTTYYDETVKTIPDNRSDFIPVFNALRSLCNQEIPMPDYVKKRQVVPWKK